MTIEEFKILAAKDVALTEPESFEECLEDIQKAKITIDCGLYIITYKSGSKDTYKIQGDSIEYLESFEGV